jgi:hypothetical protein
VCQLPGLTATLELAPQHILLPPTADPATRPAKSRYTARDRELGLGVLEAMLEIAGPEYNHSNVAHFVEVLQVREPRPRASIAGERG